MPEDFVQKLFRSYSFEETDLTCRLQELNLSKNSFLSFPPEICQLKFLKSLDISGNYLGKCDLSSSSLKHTSNMPAIQILNISRNNLSNFNLEYFLSNLLPNCSQLVSLTAERNNIDSLSSILLEFNNLRELNLSDNKIKSIDFNKFKFNKLEVIFFF